MVDLFITFFSIAIIIFVAMKKFKFYKKNGFTKFCGGKCNYCEKICNKRKV